MALTRNEQTELEIRAEAEYRWKCETDLGFFMRESWKVLQPGRELVWYWGYDYINEHLQLVRDGKLTRVIFNVSPRTLKSFHINVCFPAFVWTTEPNHNFFTASHAMDLSRDHSVARRTLMESDWYRGLWGGRWSFATDQNEKAQYKNTATGMMIATSVGSGIGKGGNTLILDDSLPPDRLTSDAERKATHEWIDTTWASRLNDPATGVQIIIEQRTGPEDTTGYLMESQPGDWTRVSIPLVWDADAEGFNGEDQVVTFPVSGRKVIRKVGDVLQPERFTPKVVAEKKKKRRVYKAQYQQNPEPPGGVLLKREWWKFYHTMPARFDQVIESWDMAFKDLADSSFVVGLVIGRIGADKYVLDCVWKQMNFTATRQAVKTLSAKWPQATRKLIEDKANGPAIMNSLQHEVSGMIPIPAQGSKYSRVEAASGDVESGNVYLPEFASWTHDAIEECARFPKEPNDWPDALAQAINWFGMQGNGMLEFYGMRNKAEQEIKESLEAKKKAKVVEKPREWSDAIRTIGMCISANVQDVQELKDWIAFLRDRGDEFRAVFAEKELDRLEKTR